MPVPALDLGALHGRPGLDRLLAALDAEGGSTRFVGGVVRDTLLGLPVADVDLATRLLPDDVIRRLAAADIRAIPTGLSHGTVTAIAGGLPYEVTTLRHDVATDGRRAKVAHTGDWQADAMRRDFTLNALYADPVSGALFDWFGGIEDLRARRVRFIGDPLQRIAEDHLRILRFFRFSARFANRLDEAGLAACAARANDLMALSRERIRDELLKILAVPDPVPTIDAMLRAGILAPIIPEIGDTRRLGALVATEAAVGASPDGLRRLAALLPPDPALAADMAARLRLSNFERSRLVADAETSALPVNPRALAYRIGVAAARDRLLLAGGPGTAAALGLLLDWEKPRLPVSGRDLIALGVAPGPAVSRLLARVEAAWIAAGFPDDRDEVLAMARSVVASEKGAAA
jgi:poly(A) polymerase